MFRVQVLQEPRKGLGLPFGLQASDSSSSSLLQQQKNVDGNIMARCDDIIASTNLMSPEAMGGYSPVIISQLLSNPLVNALMKTANLKESDLLKLLNVRNYNNNNYLVNLWTSIQATYNDVFSSNQDFIDY